MRVPPELLEPHLPVILESVLLWAEDTKNRLKLKVRHIVERLAKRCGPDAVAAAIPPSEAKLWASIAKEAARRERRKHGASEDGAGGDAVSSRGAKTARASDWGKTEIFSDDDGETEGGARGARSVASTKRDAKRDAKRGGRLADDGEPMNLLDASASRHLVKTAAGLAPISEEDDFARDALGKMVINEEKEDDPFRDPYATKKKRKNPDNDSEDEDFEALKGIAGFARALQSTEGAASLSHAQSYARSHASKATTRRGGKAASVASRAQTSRTAKSNVSGVVGGKRFAAKKAHGDVGGGAPVEPFAYWKLDKTLLNRRKAKSRSASEKLGGLVNSDAPERGNKAKRRKFQT